MNLGVRTAHDNHYHDNNSSSSNKYLLHRLALARPDALQLPNDLAPDRMPRPVSYTTAGSCCEFRPGEAQRALSGRAGVSFLLLEVVEEEEEEEEAMLDAAAGISLTWYPECSLALPIALHHGPASFISHNSAASFRIVPTVAIPGGLSRSIRLASQ